MECLSFVDTLLENRSRRRIFGKTLSARIMNAPRPWRTVTLRHSLQPRVSPVRDAKVKYSRVNTDASTGEFVLRMMFEIAKTVVPLVRTADTSIRILDDSKLEGFINTKQSEKRRGHVPARSSARCGRREALRPRSGGNNTR